MAKVSFALLLVVVSAISACKESDRAPESVANAAEIECQKSDGFEAMLCSDPEISAMQADLDKMLGRVVSRSDHNAQAGVRAAQKKWQANRDACLGLSTAKQRQCLDASYLTRMTDLQDQLDDLK